LKSEDGKKKCIECIRKLYDSEYRLVGKIKTHHAALSPFAQYNNSTIIIIIMYDLSTRIKVERVNAERTLNGLFSPAQSHLLLRSREAAATGLPLRCPYNGPSLTL
jgi:hypothetical protein